MFKNYSVKAPLGGFHVAELAQRADVTPATIRYYSRIGLLNPERKAENGYRCFSTEDLRRVEFIRQAQELGLTICDIKTILAMTTNGEVPSEQVKSLVEQRRVSIKDRIADLRATEARIAKALRYWAQTKNPVPAAGEFCPLIERLETQDSLTE